MQPVKIMSHVSLQGERDRQAELPSGFDAAAGGDGSLVLGNVFLVSGWIILFGVLAK